jgi:ABC-2 type transport system permease protein
LNAIGGGGGRCDRGRGEVGGPECDSVVLFNPAVSLGAVAALTVVFLVTGTVLYARSEKNR